MTPLRCAPAEEKYSEGFPSALRTVYELLGLVVLTRVCRVVLFPLFLAPNTRELELLSTFCLLLVESVCGTIFGLVSFCPDACFFELEFSAVFFGLEAVL